MEHEGDVSITRELIELQVVHIQLTVYYCVKLIRELCKYARRAAVPSSLSSDWSSALYFCSRKAMNAWIPGSIVLRVMRLLDSDMSTSRWPRFTTET
jgi:hypothetical protein